MSRTARGSGLALACGLMIALAGCGAAKPAATETIPSKLLAGMRPIGAGARFHPAVTGAPTGGCHRSPGTLEAHIELFGANRVVLIAGGVGMRPGPPRCYGNAVTIDPTGTVFFRPGATLADLFAAWGEPLSPTRLAAFTGTVRYYVAGKPVARLPRLTEHAEIVLEVGPYVPPHSTYSFPKGL